MTQAPEQLETERLLLRRPTTDDVQTIFDRLGCDADVTRLVSFARHRTIDDARAFLGRCDTAWTTSPCGTYLIFSRAARKLVGSIGFTFETPYRASTGYILAKDSWGMGYATEALQTLASLAPTLGVQRLYALCHVDHRPSARVLEKCDFTFEGVLRRYLVFQNSGIAEPCDVRCYARLFPAVSP